MTLVPHNQEHRFLRVIGGCLSVGSSTGGRLCLPSENLMYGIVIRL